jgi:hypothetical protein
LNLLSIENGEAQVRCNRCPDSASRSQFGDEDPSRIAGVLGEVFRQGSPLLIHESYDGRPALSGRRSLQIGEAPALTNQRVSSDSTNTIEERVDTDLCEGSPPDPFVLRLKSLDQGASPSPCPPLLHSQTPSLSSTAVLPLYFMESAKASA